MLEEMVKQDMIENGFNPSSFSDVITYWAERLQ